MNKQPKVQLRPETTKHVQYRVDLDQKTLNRNTSAPKSNREAFQNNYVDENSQ